MTHFHLISASMWCSDTNCTTTNFIKSFRWIVLVNSAIWRGIRLIESCLTTGVFLNMEMLVTREVSVRLISCSKLKDKCQNFSRKMAKFTSTVLDPARPENLCNQEFYPLYLWLISRYPLHDKCIYVFLLCMLIASQ